MKKQQPEQTPSNRNELLSEEYEMLLKSKYFTDDDVLRMLKISKSTLYRWRVSGKIQYEKIGKIYYYPELTRIKMYEAMELCAHIHDHKKKGN
ncbi:helix-turn-helix domain-containing protein [Zhouia sp. PK063]|uniref:helix-turn-helix domain-containing protein n=1 Tax=Zhouia sp. PK063 TaxID=3373602 RepID=UPI00379D0504